MQCPNIISKEQLRLEPDNIPVVFEGYTYYRHNDSYGRDHGERAVNVQFCKKKGRKRDVFECLNENEWRNCHAFKGFDK